MPWIEFAPRGEKGCSHRLPQRAWNPRIDDQWACNDCGKVYRVIAIDWISTKRWNKFARVYFELVEGVKYDKWAL